MPLQTSNQKVNYSKKGRYTALLFVFVVLLLGFVGLINQQSLYDWARLRGYTPPADIAKLAKEDQLTSVAQRVFYVNHPTIENKSSFSTVCPNGSKEAAVLGCYIPDQRGIYVLQVNDQKLSGIEQVTAAHELLHAEYDRLDAKTKSQVDTWLIDYDQHGLHDQNIIDQMNTYKKTEPNDLVNEMHSVFGTEVTNLPPNLEHYYSRYFSQRSVIADYYTTYENAFTSRVNQIKQDDVQLSTWKDQITVLETDIKAKQAALAASQQQLESERSSGNISAFNAGVPEYNSHVNSYNAEVGQVHTLVQQYNQLVAERNGIALEEQQLIQDITAGVSPISK